MKNDLISSLPTPIAVPLASYDLSSNKDPRRFFTLIELTLMYVEYVLRAQCKDIEGLSRPEPMGQRIRRVQLLYERLSSHGQMPMINAWNDRYYNEKLASIVQVRNQWAHARHDDIWRHSASIMSDYYEIFLDTLRPLTNVYLLLVKLTSSGKPQCYLLQGTKALFEPQRYRQVELPDDVKQFSLLAHNKNIGTIPLGPFFHYSKGPYGENRIEFLTTLQNGAARYIDPLPNNASDNLQ